MQSSHRNFLAVSITAAVILGPADITFAQSQPSESLEFSDRLHEEPVDSKRETQAKKSLSLFIGNSQATEIAAIEPQPGSTLSQSAALSVSEEILAMNAEAPEFMATLGNNFRFPVESSSTRFPSLSEVQSSTAAVAVPESIPPFPGAIAQIEDPLIESQDSDLPEVEPLEPGVDEGEPELLEEPLPEDPVLEEPLLEDSVEDEPVLDEPVPDTTIFDESVPELSPTDDTGEEVLDTPSTESDVLDEPDVDDFEDDAESLILEAPAPEYLNADPNPLFFPTAPEEVEIIGTQPISLEQALELARRNSRELQTAQTQLERAQADLREQQAQRFPNLAATSQIVHQDQNQAFEQTNALGQPIESDDNTTTLTGAVELSYDLFTSGARAAQIRAAERALQIQQLQVEVVLEELRLNVTNAYYDLQESDEAVRIARDTLAESLESLRVAEARERAGVGTRFDRLQAEVDAANSQQELRNAISTQQIARRQLAQILSLASGFDITAADPVEVAGAWPLSLEETTVLAYRNRAEPEQALLERELNQAQRRAELAQFGPQVSLFARYQFQDLLDETRGPSDSETLSVGAEMNLLLFDGGARRARARRERADIELAEIDFADTLEEIRFDVEEAYYQLSSNFENIQTAQIAVEVARESLRLARLRFEAGVGIQSDVITAQADLTQAETNLVNAILDYNRALVGIQRAVSNLAGNQLADVP